ncbi:unnamed protein product [Alternaria alternata]
MLSSPLPKKPKAAAEGLPIELWTLICHSRSSYSDGEEFIIDFLGLSNLRLTSRALNRKIWDAFLQRHFASSKFSLMPQSLQDLKRLSEDEQLHRYVRELEFGPEILNTNLEVDLQYIKEQGEEPSTGYPHPESYIYVDSARPIWPIVKLPRPLREGVTSRDSEYGDTLKRLVERQNHFRAGTGYLREAIIKFPALNSIKINPRPVGNYYEQRFAEIIKRSRGTTPLFRELGAHELELTTDTAPYGSESILEFSLDGLLFMEYYAEINMLENLFNVLSSVDLGKFTVDLTITAANLLSNGKVFDISHRTWTAMAPRVRSLTFDFAMSDMKIYQVPPLLTWIAEMSHKPAQIYKRHIPYLSKDTARSTVHQNNGIETMASRTTIFITGANTGLGLHTVKALYRSTNIYDILLGARDSNKASAAIDEIKQEYPNSTNSIEGIQIDLQDDASIAQAFETVSRKHGKIDVLLNNAGAQFDQQVPKGNMTIRDMWNKSWDVNVTGTYIVTEVFAPLLLKSSHPRLVFITSGTSTLTEHDNLAMPINRSPPKGWPKESFAVTAYRAAKTGMNMMVLEWARMLKEDGVKVFAVSPGMLATGLGGDPEAMKKMGAIDPKIGAELVRDVVEGRRDEDVGKVVRKNNVQPW